MREWWRALFVDPLRVPRSERPRVILLIRTSYDDFVGGAQLQAERTALELSRDFDVVVMSRSLRIAPGLEDRGAYHLLRRPAFGWSPRAARDAGQGQPGRWQAARALLDVVLCLWQLRLLASGARAIVGYMTLPSGMVATLAGRWFGVASIVAIRAEYEYLDNLRSAPKRLLSLSIWALADRLLVQSPAVRDTLLAQVEHACPGGRQLAAKVAVVPNGVEVAARGESASGLIFVGRLDPMKGLDVLVEALRGMESSARPRLTIVGQGPHLAALRASTAGLPVELAGELPHAEVLQRLASAEIFVLPSLRDAMPNALLEAMAAGLAVIATPVGAIPNLIRDGEQGLLVPLGDAQALRAAILRLNGDAALRARLGSGARLAVADMSWDRVRQSMGEEIERAARHRHPVCATLAPASKRERAARLVDRGPIGPLLRRLPTWRGVLVLNYHRIADGPASLLDQGVWSATAAAFDRQVAWVARNVDLVGPGDLAELARRGRGRAVMLTFDDGYRDNYELALPILLAHRATATFFLTTGFLDQPGRLAWWDEIAWMVRASTRQAIAATAWLDAPLQFDEPDREQAVRTLLARYKLLPTANTEAFLDFVAESTGSGRQATAGGADVWMTWGMARALRDAGMTLGGHTVSHPVLARLSPAQQQAEIAGCKARFEAELGGPMRWFAYPIGKPGTFDAVTRACLSDQGVELAFSFAGGIGRFDDWDRYDIPRLPITSRMSGAQFRAVLTLPQVFARAVDA